MLSGSKRATYPLQKEVVKPIDAFECTKTVLIGGNSKPIVARKVTSKTEKYFALKKFDREQNCAREKLCYDLLKLCGVTVPKTYILADKEG